MSAGVPHYKKLMWQEFEKKKKNTYQFATFNSVAMLCVLSDFLLGGRKITLTNTAT